MAQVDQDIQVSMDGTGGSGHWNHRGHQFSRQLHLQSAPGSPFPSWLLLLRTLAQVNHGKWILFSEYRGFFFKKKKAYKNLEKRESIAKYAYVKIIQNNILIFF